MQVAGGAIRSALLFSSGAMFGAYHAGAWKALRGRVPVDAVAGASIGSLNGWAVAGDAEPELLMERWRSAEAAGSLRFRWPRRVLDGCLEVPFLCEWIQQLYGHFQPRVEYGVVLTRTWPFRPELVRTPDVEWQHLASSCALPFLFPHYRMRGAVYTDGGLMQALPLWPAKELGCGAAIAINCLPTLPFPGGKLSSRAMRAVSRHNFGADGTRLLHIAPTAPLGNTRDFLLWDRKNVERWMAQGERDAEDALRRHPDFLRAVGA